MKERSFKQWIKDTLKRIFGCACIAIAIGCTDKTKAPEPAPSPTVTPSPTPTPSGAKAKLSGLKTYLTFYGEWNSDRIAKAKQFPLIIAKQSTTKEEVKALKSAGAKVVLYVSVGEEDEDVRDIGDKLGPIKCDGMNKVFTKKGVDSQYVIVKDGREKGPWGSFYTDGGNPKWQAKVLAEAKRLISMGADGIFLDTVDTAAPTGDGAPCTASGMADLIGKLRAAMPDKYIISNRGLFFLDPSKATYSHDFRKAVTSVMFENYYTSWDDDDAKGKKSNYFLSSHVPAAKYVQAEAIKPDGFTVLALDYFSESQLTSSLLAEQRAEVAKLPGWVNGIGNYDLDAIYMTLLK